MACLFAPLVAIVLGGIILGVGWAITRVTAPRHKVTFAYWLTEDKTSVPIFRISYRGAPVALVTEDGLKDLKLRTPKYQDFEDWLKAP